MALADLKGGSGKHGYTKGEIETFWVSNQSEPLFFVSMLNLSATGDLDSVLSEIGDKFPPGRHLAYITFDHCDIIIFAGAVVSRSTPGASLISTTQGRRGWATTSHPLQLHW